MTGWRPYVRGTPEMPTPPNPVSSKASWQLHTRVLSELSAWTRQGCQQRVFIRWLVTVRWFRGAHRNSL
jgi:hypothetical protein